MPRSSLGQEWPRDVLVTEYEGLHQKYRRLGICMSHWNFKMTTLQSLGQRAGRPSRPRISRPHRLDFRCHRGLEISGRTPRILSSIVNPAIDSQSWRDSEYYCHSQVFMRRKCQDDSFFDIHLRTIVAFHSGIRMDSATHSTMQGISQNQGGNCTF